MIYYLFGKSTEMVIPLYRHLWLILMCMLNMIYVCVCMYVVYGGMSISVLYMVPNVGIKPRAALTS